MTSTSTSLTRFIKTAAFPAAIIALLLVVALHWVHLGYFIAESDINIPDFPWNQFHQCVMPWNYSQSYLGQPSWCFTWAPMIFIHASLASMLGGSTAEALVLVLPYIAAVAGAFVLGRVLGLSNLASFAIAIVYAFNPYTQLMIGVNPVVPVFTALLAWIAMLLVLAAKRPERRRACSIALFAIFAWGVSTTVIVPHCAVDLAIACLVWLPIASRFSEDRAAYRRWLFRTFGLVCLASIWWVLPTLVAIASSQNTNTGSVANNAWTFVRSSLLNNLRLNPVWMWQHEAYFPNAAAYDYNLVTYPAGFLFAGVALVAMVRLRGSAMRIAGVLTLAALALLFVCKGPHEPLGALSSAIMSLPILFVLQDPGGLIVASIFCFAIVTGLVVEDARRSGRLAPFLAAVVVTVFALASSAQLLSGDILHKATVVAPSMYVRVPQYWHDLSQALAGDPNAGGVLYMPRDAGYDAWYTWDYYGADTLPIDATQRRSLVPAAPFGYFTSSQRNSIYDRLSDLIASGSPLAEGAVRDVGIRFVVERGDLIAATPSEPAWLLRRAFPHGSFARLGALTLIDAGKARPLFTDWNDWIEGSSDVTPGAIAEISALTGDARPRLTDGQGPAHPPALYEISAVKSSSSNAGPRRIVEDDPSKSWSAAIAGNAPAPTLSISFDAGNFDLKPSYTSPYLYIAESPAARPPRALSAASLFTGLQAFALASYNPGLPAPADVVARCRSCAPGARVALVVGGRTYPSVVRATSSDFNVAFPGVLFPSGIANASFTLPAGLAFHVDDLVIDTRGAPDTAAASLDAYFPATLRLQDHPIVTHEFLGTTAYPAEGFFVVFVRTGRATLACPVAYTDPGSQYDLFAESLSCLRRHGISTDVPSVAAATIDGIGYYDLANTTHVEVPVGRTISLHVAETHYRQRSMIEQVPTSDGAGGTQFGIDVADGVRSTDILDGFFFDLDPVAHPTQLTLQAKPYEQTWPFLSADPGAVVANQVPFTSDAPAAITVRSQGAAPSAFDHGELRLWERLDRWTVHFAGRVVSGPLALLGSVVHVAMPAGTYLTVSPGIPNATVAVIGRPQPAQGPSGSCDSAPDLAVLQCDAGADSVLVFNTGYHWSWIALQGVRPLRHVRADGWRNAWVVPGSGTVTVLNLLDLLTPLLALATLAVFVVLLLPRGRSGRQA